jgi:uncharacterized protein (TIGR02284 family)
MTPEKLIGVLNQLITTCYESRDGYNKASTTVDSLSLEVLFTSYADQRDQFARELSDIVLSMGGIPAQKGNVLGLTYRAWSAVRRLNSSDYQAILAICAQSEHAAFDIYREALNQKLPSQIELILTEQSTQITHALSRISDLRQRTAFQPQPTPRKLYTLESA